MQNRRYPINLSASMAVCDANYIRILKLLPGFGPDACREISLPALGSEYPDASVDLVLMQVEERFRYTSTVSIRLLPKNGASSFFRPPLILVRLYHDACTAEVVSYQTQRGFHLHSQPGAAPEFSADEKQQVNALLADWLTLCLEQGMVSHNALAHDADYAPL